MRAGTGRDRRRDPLRGLGRDAGGGRGARRERRGRVGAMPSPRRGRADGRDHQPVDAGVGRRERCRRQPRVLQLQRGPGQGPALRRQPPRRSRPPALDGHGVVRVLQAGVRALGGVELRPIMAQALHMGDEVHNRNAAATGLLFKRLVPALLDRRSPGRRRAPRDQVRRRQRPLLPEPLDGGLQGDARRGARRAHSTMVTVDGAQRRELRHPLAAAPATPGSRPPPTRSTACFSPATASRMPPPTSATARSPRPPAWAGSRWPRRPRSCSSSAARRPTRPRTAAACARSRWDAPRLHAAGAEFRRDPGGIDARLVVDTGILPIINTGIAHREAGVGQIGAGITTAPLECFLAAIDARRRRATERRPREPDRRRRARWQRARHRRRPPGDRRPVRRRALGRRPARRARAAGLGARRQPWQRATGRLHPAPLGDGAGRAGAGPDGLRGRRHPGRDRLHVPQGDRQRAAPPGCRPAGRRRS